MGKYIIVIWMALFLIHCSSTIYPPLDTGCSKELNRQKCIYELYCLNEINEDVYNFRWQHQYSSDCRQIILYGNYFYGLHVTYRGLADEIPKGNDNTIMLIRSLDLSANEYNVPPNLKAMNNLEYLNLSRNYLTTAKLHNIHELVKLVELDLSFNRIYTIEVAHANVFHKLRTLNLSHNELANLPNAIFGDLTELLSLDLSHNVINTIGISSFEGLKKLSSLCLSHNRITAVNGAFFRFSRLQKLDLSHNRLSEIKFHDFEELEQLIHLNLTDNSILSIESSAFSKMNLLQSLKLDNNKLQDISKILFFNNVQLEHLDVSHNDLKLLPCHMFKEQSFVFFDLSSNNLEGALSKGTFDGFERVTLLDLSNQQLTALENNAFYGLQALSSLYLNKNKLQVISSKTFINLTNLIRLDLSDNNLKDFQFDTTDLIHLHVLLLRNNMISQIKHDNFQGLSAIQFLDLSGNQINKLDPRIFDSLRQLIDFNVSSNPLNGSLETATFDGLVSLPLLDISDTQLTIVQNGSFTSMIHLKRLTISRNKLVELQYNSFTGINNVELIDISYNQLTTLELNLADLVKLKEILLNHNFLKVIGSNTFTGLKSLTKLDLSHNHIKSINESAFENLKFLHYLDISYNSDMAFNVSFINQNKNLKEIILSGLRCETKLFALGDNSISKLDMSNSTITNITSLDIKKLTNLQYLILSYNNVSGIDVGTFSDLVSVDTIDLSVNKLTFIQPGAFQDNEYLQLLNISHNNLTTISYGALAGLLNLKTLDLSYNNIKVIDSERFYEVPSLKVLILDYNNINFVSTEEFSGTKLNELSIGGNNIACENLVNFKKSVAFKISAIKKYETNNENVDGITCTTDISYITNQNENKVQNDHEIFSDIRDTLHKIENNNVFPVQAVDSHSHLLSNISQEVQKFTNDYDAKLSTLINVSSTIVKENENKTDQLFTLKESVDRTNTLLEQILSSLNQRPVSKNVSNFNDLIRYIDNVKNEIESKMLVEKTKIDELESKIDSAAGSHVETFTSKTVQENLLTQQSIYNDDDKNVTESKPALFTKICLGLILLILICFIMYKFYKARKHFIPRRSSYSTRELHTSMETPEL